jgi:glucose/arabinose dehydrogenase
MALGVALSFLIVADQTVSVMVRTVSAASPPPPPVRPPARLFGPPGGTTKSFATVTAQTPEAGFSDTIAIGSLTRPTVVRFASDGSVFVAEKSGLVKRFPSLTSTSPTVVADLSGEVDDYWDRGLLGFALDPNYPASPYVYVLYTYDAPIGGTAPTWNDACPTPPGPTTDGCVVSGRLSRLKLSGTFATETVLINDWCQQFPSHSMGALQFGADGALYASAGEGASWINVDYGQFGGSAGSPTPSNPCGDPPVGSGGFQSPPGAEGGALRSQSLRRPSTQPVALGGSVIRVDPATGAALPTNPLSGSADPNARRIVGYGLRNPFRFAIRPGTNDVWIGNVGWNTWEAIDRVVNPIAPTVANFGWPCYEGPAIQSAYQAANLDLCTSLYASPTGLVSPYYAYNHNALVVSGETCPTGSSSISGLAFYTSGTYPTSYNGALFFADHSRNCIWAMLPGSDGLPDPNNIQTFVAAASNPVDLEIGPGGDLFYVDHEGGAIHRVTHTVNAPTALIKATPTSGPVPLTVNFDGTGSTDPNQGGTLSYSWDLNGDGVYGDSTSATPSWTYSVAGTVSVGLRVTDSASGLSATATISIAPGSIPPVPTIDSPSSSLTWAVGDTISFTGHAVDSHGVSIPATGLSWSIILHHCPSTCHTHLIQTFNGVVGGSFAAPDHDYPSWLEIVLTATDANNLQAQTSVSLNPKTVQLTFQSSPTGLSLAVGSAPAAATPFTATKIQGSAVSLNPPSPQILNGVVYQFQSWSDAGEPAHTVIASASAIYTATFVPATYVSDIGWTTMANGWGPAEPDMSNGEQAAGDGHPITLHGVVYSKGLGVHEPSDISYTLAGMCSSFTSDIGIDAEVGNNGSVIFQVLADGTKVYDSGVVTWQSPTKTVSVTNLSGVKVLDLVVIDDGDGPNYDHADWAGARVTCPRPGSPLSVSARSPVAGATGVSTTADVTATFSVPIIARTTLGAATFNLVPRGGTIPIAATVTYDPTSRTARLHPSSALAPGTTYNVTLKGGPGGIADLSGTPLAADVAWTFTTARRHR